MNFLRICQDIRQEATDSGTGPSTVVGQTGELGRFVKWGADAYSELQLDRDDWLWLRSRFTVNTVASTASYAYGSCTDTGTGSAITRFSRWYWGLDKDGMPYCSAYLASTGVAGEFYLSPMDWDRFERVYQFGTQSDAQPQHISINPSTLKFHLGPVPDAVYTVRGIYQKSPQTLALDADTPEMPAQFHNLIVFDALAKYGANRVAHEAIARAISEGGRIRAALERNQLPQIGFGKPLA